MIMKMPIKGVQIVGLLGRGEVILPQNFHFDFDFDDFDFDLH